MAVKWFRFYTESAYHREIQELPAPLFKFWVNALCLANAHDPRGTLPPIADVAYALHLTAKQAGSLLDGLTSRGLVDGDTGAIHNWGKWQFDSDARASEGRTRGDSAANLRRHGGAKKQKQNRSRTEADSDTEAEAEAEGSAAAAFKSFEDCIGSLSAYMARKLEDDVTEFGETCVIHCLEEAAANGARNLKYAETIMRRHQTEGCYDDERPRDDCFTDEEIERRVAWLAETRRQAV